MTDQVIPRVRQVLAHAVYGLCKMLAIPDPMSVLNATGGEIERLYEEFVPLVSKVEGPDFETVWKIRVAERRVARAMETYSEYSLSYN